jgi:hypothetical protein
MPRLVVLVKRVNLNKELAEQEMLQNKIPAATEEANQGSDPEKKQADNGTELYRINDWKSYCKLLLRSVRVLPRGRGEPTTSWWT